MTLGKIELLCSGIPGFLVWARRDRQGLHGVGLAVKETIRSKFVYTHKIIHE